MAGGDDEGLRVLRRYPVYRALLRAKVARRCCRVIDTTLPAAQVENLLRTELRALLDRARAQQPLTRSDR